MKIGLVLAIAVVPFCSCVHRKHLSTAPPPPATGADRTEPETGLASWYGYPYHGRPAADGEIYDMEKLTAAHRTLPFNTLVRVVNLENTKTVDVRIIDRGPFVEGRIIDLSHAAARAIDIVEAGTAMVRVEVLRRSDSEQPGAFGVQVGAFRNRANAERLRADMAARYGAARLTTSPADPTIWRVVVGAEPTEDGARALSDRIRRESGEKFAFVVRLDS